MTALIFPDEVLLERDISEKTVSFTFEFKGHQFYLSHRYEFSLHHNKHHFVGKIDGLHYSFGVARSKLVAGSYGNRPEIKINGKLYRFSVLWPDSEGRFGVRLASIHQ